MSRNYLVTPQGGVIYTGAVLVAALGLFAMPAHAAEPASQTNQISITVEQAANLTLQDDLYKATSNIVVKSSSHDGFSITMVADKQDLVNSANSNYKITAVKKGAPSTLPANQWGYSLDQSSDKYSQVPAKSAPLRLANVTPNTLDGCKSVTECTKPVTFAANIDSTNLPAGEYITHVVYTVTPKLAPKPPVVSKSICRAGSADNDCKVDIDPDMVPVKYTGSTTDAQWTSVANPEDANSGWYDYANKQWANAVTVKKEAYAKYKDKSVVVDPADILGHWVYIPRYAYEVMRRDYTDKLVKEQNFNIHFEKATDPKRIPAVCTSKGVDYRTECDLNRDYIDGKPSDAGTWATHPAFTFGTRELNGIWFAKFQTTGDLKQPTVLPNQKYLSGDADGVNGKLEELFAAAKSFGVVDSGNTVGSTLLAAQNNNNLAHYSSRIINNNDWGAAAYLSASQYGAGFDKVEPNNQSGFYQRRDKKKNIPKIELKYGITGCGAMRGKNGKFSNNKYGGEVGTQSACSSLDSQLAYNGTTGQLASTTNNPTGIYDMAGGGREVVAAAYSDDPSRMVLNPEYKNTAFDTKPPYTNLYHFASINRYECTWETCGGQSLHEVEYDRGTYLSACGPKHGTMWNMAFGVLAGGCYNDTHNEWNYNLWFTRGGDKGGLSLFYASAYNGKVDKAHSFRVVLGDFRQ